MQLLGGNNPLSGAGDRLIDTATDIGGGLNKIATSPQKVDSQQAALEGIGETVWSAGTLGRAHETREQFLDAGDNREKAAEVNDEVENADGTLGNLGAFNEQLKLGLDFTLDNPSANVQDTVVDGTTAVSGADDTEDVAEVAEDLHTGYEGLQEPLADAYKPKIEAGFDAAGLDAPNAETVLQEAPGTATEWFVEDPVEAAATAATGIDPETGETDADPTPLDLVDVALVGGGKVLKGGAKASKAASSAKLLDDISVPTADGLSTSLTRGVDNAVPSGASDSLTSGLSGALVGGAAALGGAKAGKTMLKGIDEVGKLLGRVSRGGDSAADDVASNAGRTADDGITIEPEGVGLADESTESAARSVGDSGSMFDEGITIEQSVDDTVASFDEQLNSLTDTVSRGSDDAAPAADEVSGANGGSDLLGGVDESVDNAVDDALGGVDDTVNQGTEGAIGSWPSTPLLDEAGGAVRNSIDNVVNTFRATDDATPAAAGSFDEFAAGDGLLNRAWRPFNNGINRIFGSSVRATDDGIVGADNVAAAADDVASSAADDVVAGADDVAAATDDTASTLGRVGSGIGSTGKLALGGIGVSLALAFTGDALGVDLFGSPGGSTTGQEYKQGPIKPYPKTSSALFEVFQRGDEGWVSQGYTVVLGPDKEGRFVDKGAVAVLSTAGEPIQSQPMTQTEDGSDIYKPRFDTTDAADEAHAAFVEKLRNEGYTDEDQDVPAAAEGIKGSLDAPSKIAAGEAFTAKWEVSTDGQREAAGRLVLAVQTPSGLGTLAETRYSLGPNSASQSGTFKTPNGWSGLDAGSHTMYAISTGDNEGVVAKDSVEITNDESAPDRSSDSSPSDEDSSGASWGDPEIVQELPHGWYLMAQPRTDGPEQVRFLVAGKRSDGDEIYVHPDGRAKTEAHTFPTAEKASTAFQKWVKRFENGQTKASEEPSEDADRPSQNAVSRDAKQGSGGASGSLQRAKQAASENPAKAAAAVAGAAIVGYYLYKKGYLDGPIGWIEGAIPNGVIPS